MRFKEPAEVLSSFEEAAARHDDDNSVAGGVCGEGVSSGVGEQLDPSRLPLAQRQLHMRIQLKQHRDEINSKPISDITAKRLCFSLPFTTVRIGVVLCHDRD